MRYDGNLSKLIPEDINPLGEMEGVNMDRRLKENAEARKYLLALCYGWSKSRACMAAGIQLTKPTRWRRESPAFVEMEQECIQAGDDLPEDVAHQMAVVGETEYRVIKGEDGIERKVKIGVKRDTALLRTILAGRKPEKYGTNRQHIQTTHVHQVSAGESVLAMLEDRRKEAIEADYEVVSDGNEG